MNTTPPTVTLALYELDPETLANIIECLATQDDRDPRLPALKAQWDLLTRQGE